MVPPFGSELQSLKKKKLNVSQSIKRLQIKMYRMNKSTPATDRKLRTRTLIQLGGLIEKAGVLDALEISLGDDLQKDVDVKEAMITLFGALIDMKETVLADPDQKHLCLLQGRQAFLENASL